MKTIWSAPSRSVENQRKWAEEGVYDGSWRFASQNVIDDGSSGLDRFGVVNSICERFSLLRGIFERSWSSMCQIGGLGPVCVVRIHTFRKH